VGTGNSYLQTDSQEIKMEMGSISSPRPDEACLGWREHQIPAYSQNMSQAIFINNKKDEGNKI